MACLAIIKLSIIFAAFIVGTFSLVFTSENLSSYETMTTGVKYEINFTLTTIITAGSTFTITFPTEYRIPASTLSNCKGSIS